MQSHTQTYDTGVPADASRSLPSLVHSALATSGAISPLFVRLSLAVVLFPHGAQKLFGWFGGYGFEGTMGFFTQTMGLPYLLALGVILIEVFGPILLVLGLGTRLAALATGVVMASAMVLVQWQYGFFMNWFGQQEGEGIEYTLLFLGGVAALLASGGGRGSLDRWLTRDSAQADA